MVANITVMHTACTLSLALAILSALHLYWAFGGTWGLAAALGREQIELSASLRIAAGAVAIALAVACLVESESGASPCRGCSSRGGCGRSWLERLLFAPIALVLGLLALTIARSPRP
jgi:hypothetical protein